MLRRFSRPACYAFIFLSLAAAAQQVQNGNLALSARVIASSSSEDTRPENLIDGDIARTHWSAKDGEIPSATWVELHWSTALDFQEVVIRQENQPRLSHIQLEINDAGGGWHDFASAGDSEHLLPRNVLFQFATQTTRALRISGFEGTISLNEIEVYNRKDAPVLELGSDLLNHIVGVVTDAFGTRPFVNCKLELAGTAGGKQWMQTSETDENGVFQVEMPVGLDGTITASALLADGTQITRRVPAGDFSPGLSALDKNSPAIDLRGTWLFKADPGASFAQPDLPDADWKKIRVPSHWVMEGFTSESGVGAYRLHLHIPENFRNQRVKLVFDGVYSGAEVWLNGKRCGAHEGGFAPFELDVTEAAKVGAENLLAVLVTEKTSSSHFDNMSYYADFPLSGIFRGVHLFAVPSTHLRRFHLTTTFDSQYQDANLSFDLSVENESETSGSTELTLQLVDPQGHAVPLTQNQFDLSLAPWSRRELKASLPIASPKHWEAEHPLLYTLSAKLVRGGTTIETVSRHVGFRQIEVRGTQLLINGSPVKLRGIAYFEVDPLRGRVITPETSHHDLEMMKEANLDAFRTEVILPLEELYNEADAMGFYVEAESPFCWVDESSDLRYLPLFIQRTAEILDRDRSHPSVIIWSLANESTWGPDFEAAYRFVKRTDTSRPLSAGQSARLDLDTMHNPISLERMKEREDVPVPILWDESFCIFQGHLWGDTREMWLDPGDRDYYIAPLIDIWDAVQASKNVQGSMIWAWIDDIFLVPGRDSEYGRSGIGRPEHPLDSIYHVPGRGIVGDAPWGIVDGWRRKKPEFWHVKMLMSPVHMTQRALPGWAPGSPASFTIDNRYDFTNLSEIRLEWSIGTHHGLLHPDVAPHTSKAITLTLPSDTKAGDYVSLRWTGDGGLVAPFRIRLGTPPVIRPNTDHPHPVRYIHDSSWLEGPLERFLGDNFEIAFDAPSGFIKRALVDGHSVIYGTPKLHVLPIQESLREVPLVESWRLLHPLEIRTIGDTYEVVEMGTYREWAGELRFRIFPDGGLAVNYDFTYTGSDLRARETGLQFGVPLWCDRLDWKRRGEWSVYPDDHIGRNEGSAMARAAEPQPVPPTQSFNLDDTPLGTNDFRSTKRDFVFASLTDKDGYGVGIQAVGSQHLRASVSPDMIEVNVNDWFGGTAAVAWGEWWQNYGQGRELRSDDPTQGLAHNRLSGTVQLQLFSPTNATTWRARMDKVGVNESTNQ
ncbi:MAG TPA: glycoside hydrolase family 2 TIM barrel-domain containing protein [Candidatus Sulfotelmatobacter sp.]|nr:glycoside hydrolase family 2 TIM barrel-domain containing protein [Candidatus Sulfotelmatobacter sp.]